MKESKIFNQDCLKTMSAIGKEKADLILTDPPYNLGLFMKNRDTNINAMRSNHFADNHNSGSPHTKGEAFSPNH